MVRTWWAAWRLSLEIGQTLLAAGATIALRSAAIGSALARGRLPPAAETVRMVSEKPAAAAEAAVALARAAGAGTTPAGALEAARAALRPIHRRTRANARRLGRRRRSGRLRPA